MHVSWTKEQSSANYFANEARQYARHSPVEAGRARQLGLPIKLPPEQTAQAVNEQYGFVLEQQHHNKNAHGKFLVKSAKYHDRSNYAQ